MELCAAATYRAAVAELARPQVVITDPARPRPLTPPPAAAAQGGPDGGGERSGRSRLPVLLLVLAVLAAAGWSVRGQRQQAAQERRDGALVLEVEAGAGMAVVRRRGVGVLLQADLVVRNAGARPVLLQQVEVEGTELRTREVGAPELGPGQDVRVRVAQRVSCPAQPPPTGSGAALLVTASRVVPAPEAPTTVRVEAPPGLLAGADDLLARTCGGGVAVGSEVALDLSTASRWGDDGVVLSLQLTNRTEVIRRVLRVLVDQEGLEVTSLDELPMELPAERFPRPPSGPGSQPRSLELVLRAAPDGCEALREAGRLSALRQGVQPLVRLVVDAGEDSPQTLTTIFSDSGGTVQQVAQAGCARAAAAG